MSAKARPKPKRIARTWPVLLLTLPAFVAIWGGWVGLGERAGFGVINLLPGLVPDLKEDGSTGWSTLNTAITLPIGLETYAAYALHVFLAATERGTLRRFAGWSALASLVIGSAGQVAHHVMESKKVDIAPVWIIAIVGCLPVAVLGMGTFLAALVRREEVGGPEVPSRSEGLGPSYGPEVPRVPRVWAEANPSVGIQVRRFPGPSVGPEVPKVSEVPSGSVGPEVSEVSKVSEVPSGSVGPEVSEVPSGSVGPEVSEVPSGSVGPEVPTQRTAPRRTPALRGAWDVEKAVLLLMDGRPAVEVAQVVGVGPKSIQRVQRALEVLRQDPDTEVPADWKVPVVAVEVIRRKVRAIN